MVDAMNCPVCLETMVQAIYLCTKGHSTCGTCVSKKCIPHCPICRSEMTNTRNFGLENMISQLKLANIEIPCTNAEKGCKYKLNPDEMESHELECKNRVHKCEGDKFGVWKCDWTGSYAGIFEHFKAAHETCTSIEFKSEVKVENNFGVNSSEIRIIDYKDGQEIFWYKHKIDVQNQKAYWLFQYVGTKEEAANYCYDLEIFSGDARKLRINEHCKSDAEDANAIFAAENCLALPLRTVKNFLNDQGELSFRYKISKIYERDSGLS